MYNQPTVKGPNGRTVGTLYKNPVDCLWKTFKAEGIRGWYKGMAGHYRYHITHLTCAHARNDRTLPSDCPAHVGVSMSVALLHADILTLG